MRNTRVHLMQTTTALSTKLIDRIRDSAAYSILRLRGPERGFRGSNGETAPAKEPREKKQREQRRSERETERVSETSIVSAAKKLYSEFRLGWSRIGSGPCRVPAPREPPHRTRGPHCPLAPLSRRRERRAPPPLFPTMRSEERREATPDAISQPLPAASGTFGTRRPVVLICMSVIR